MIFNFFPFFLFWFLVFLLSRYSRGAWCFVGIGLGWGSLYNMGEIYRKKIVSPSTDSTTGTCYLFFIDEMGGGMGGYGRAGGVRTLFAENREPTEICHCWPRGGFFCFFMRLVGSPTLPYLTFVVGTGTGKVR